ncbi:M56 family metallopeptidase [Sphingomonas sp.]|uniref:M56 family metallopeptidase n=1 Tax=Sphingomonas sp. TaxID=28214 RepID=UPI0025E65918|nr:M56 family metallopeptidase [Sphingomonas sp.]
MIGWMIEALIASTVLMAIVLVIRGPVRRSFGPGIAYALWALPAIRLVLPPLPQLPAWRSAATAATAAAPDLTQTLTVYVIEPLGGSAAAPASLFSSLGLPLAVLWGVGAAAFLCWHTVSHWRFCQRMIAGSTLAERAGAIDVIETEAASGPLAFGIFRRYVAFPRDFSERYDADERELALAHEIGHHQRGDLFANWIALGVLALHWFNPIAWRAFRAYRSDQEMANDARVLAGRSPIDRHTYACAIVKAAHGGAVSAACHLHTINDLKGRLRMLTTGPRSRTRLALGGTAVAALMIVGLAGTASGTAAAASVRAGVEKATGIDISKLDARIGAKLQSAPPAPPAMPEGSELPAPPKAASPPSAPEAPTRVKKIKIVKIDKDGNTISEDIKDIPDVPDMPELANIPELKNIPDVRSRRCGGGNGKRESMVIDKSRGDKKIMIICTDRIERLASISADNAVKSRDIQRMAYDRALKGLRSARASIAGNVDMPADARREALEGIDESIRDMESDRAERD